MAARGRSLSLPLHIWEKRMPEERTWDEFREAGLLWWTNRILHLFGWAIVVELNDDGKNVKRAYPARVTYRGFTRECETRGFGRLTRFLKREAPDLMKVIEKNEKLDEAE